jgi:hypothetical protein
VCPRIRPPGTDGGQASSITIVSPLCVAYTDWDSSLHRGVAIVVLHLQEGECQPSASALRPWPSCNLPDYSDAPHHEELREGAEAGVQKSVTAGSSGTRCAA